MKEEPFMQGEMHNDIKQDIGMTSFITLVLDVTGLVKLQLHVFFLCISNIILNCTYSP